MGQYGLGATLVGPKTPWSRLEWVEGRRGSLYGFRADGSLAVRLDAPKDGAKKAWAFVRLAVAILRPAGPRGRRAHG